MSEYWKSTPKYWCKHCGVYVRDTKLERTNHEATAKHQNAVKRSLRDIHKAADQKEREKERARQEVERLNGVVSGSRGGAASSASASRPAVKPAGGAYGAAPQQVSEAERQRQLEQLAELGVNIPTELRGSMAMAGEWTVTSTRIIQVPEEGAEGGSDEKGEASSEARAVGVKRERERTEEEKEQEEAINGLFKRPRKWGIDSKTMPEEEDAELEALLSGPLVKTKKEESEPPKVKSEDAVEAPLQGDAAESAKQEADPPIKQEPDEGEGGDASQAIASTAKAPADSPADVPAVVFKKRKPKNIRQK
ncbi:hypothetical protein VTJ83DRAFT_7097 [Remersonia thermophila]|uniref:U1-type domain-containing protein n=1 Tax=Remersonia thermophila TaxID=72144 RepID=A0ABR4D4V3_9PEZI